MSEQNIKTCSAFTVWEILLLVMVAWVIAAIAIPNRIHGGSTPANHCINNLRQLDAAANQFALVNHLTNGAPINFPSDLTNYIKLNKEGKIPPCPSGGTYHLGKIGELPTCTLSTATPAHILH